MAPFGHSKPVQHPRAPHFDWQHAATAPEEPDRDPGLPQQFQPSSTDHNPPAGCRPAECRVRRRRRRHPVLWPMSSF